MNPKFPVLSLLAHLLKLVGVLAAFAGVICVAYGIIESTQRGHSFGFENVIALALGLLMALLGLLTLAAGEVVGVLFAIEKNTRLGPGPSAS